MGRDIHFAVLYDNRKGYIPGNSEWDFVCVEPNVNDPFTSEAFDPSKEDGIMSVPFAPDYFRNQFFFDAFSNYFDSNSGKDTNLHRVLKTMIDNFNNKKDWTDFVKSCKIKMTMGTDIETLQYIFDKEDFGAFNQEIITLKSLKRFKKHLMKELAHTKLISSDDECLDLKECLKLTKQLINYFKCVKMITQMNVGQIKVKDEDIIILVSFDN